MGQSLTLIGYSSELSEMAESDKLHPSYDIPHNYRLTPDTVLEFDSIYMIICECCQMVLLFVAV